MASTDDGDYIAYVTGRLPALRRVAAQLAGDAHRGDDLVQETITRLYMHWKRASAAEHLDAYVYRILVRAFLDDRRLRWATVRLRAAAVDLEPGAGSVHPSAGVEERMLLRKALSTLPPRQRAVLVLRYLADRSVEEVARILDVTPGTVKSQTHDGLAALRRLLGQPTDSGATP